MAIDTTQAIVDRIVAQAIGVDTGTGTNVFFSRLPGTPDNALAVRVLPGAAANRAFGTATPAVRENPNVHIIARNLTIDGMILVIDALRTAFDFKTWVASDGSEFFTQLSYEPMDMGEDENHREVRSFVLDVKRTR